MPRNMSSIPPSGVVTTFLMSVETNKVIRDICIATGVSIKSVVSAIVEAHVAKIRKAAARNGGATS